jgi:hypothetical protein
MAWQLIYTSAPRLIEAGRTGFGTVARHRAVSGMLAATVERFSQFARLPGHDPRRVVHAHRILTVGPSTYHVLSCLQDAGSDYTGRTNHIAHHLIAEPREIRALSTAGLTPADVLLSMAWRTSWNEAPRYLDPSEEINLSSCAPTASHAWASVTGNPATAGILWSREAQRGCYLITPSGINALELFRESLLVEPSQAWQTRFTTCLEPNDDVADFRWIALSSTSPMRGQVETTNRLVLDLTSPATLPEPPQREAPPPALETVSPAAPGPAPRPPASVYEPMRSSGAASAPVSPMGAWSPEPRRKAAKSNKSFIGISLIIAAVMVVVVVGALLRQNNLQKQARADYEQKIAATWKNHQLVLNDTRKLLEEQPDIEEGTALLKSHEDFFRSMKRMLKQPGTSIELPLPAHTEDDLKDLKKLLEEWAELHVKPWTKLQSGQATVTALDILESYRKWQDSRNATWKQLTHSLSLQDIPLPGEELVQSLKDAAREVLRHAEPARDTRAQWEEVFKLPGDPQNSTVLEVQQWLKLWAALDDAGPQSHATAQTAASNNSLPKWLRVKAAGLKQRPDKRNEPKMALKTDEPRTQVAPKPVVMIDDADAVSATNHIYLCLLQPNEDPAGKITGLKVSDDMQLFVGNAWASHPPPDGKTESKEGELKKWLGVSSDDKDKFKFFPTLLANVALKIAFSNDGVLTAFPEELRKSPNGIRIVARSRDGLHVLFDLRLIPVSSAFSRPILTQVIETTVINAATVTLNLPPDFLSRLQFVGQKDPVYALRHDGPADQKKFFNLKSTGDSSFQVIPPVIQNGSALSKQEIKKKLEELDASIAKDDEYLAKNESSKEPAKIKAENKNRYEQSKAKKEQERQEWQTKLQNLEGNAPPHFDLMPGNFILALEQPNKIELCKLKVVLPSGHSSSKPINP